MSILLVLGPRYTKPRLQAEKKRAHHKYKEYSDYGLPSSWTVRRCYILSVFMGSSVSSRLQYGLSISWTLEEVEWFLMAVLTLHQISASCTLLSVTNDSMEGAANVGTGGDCSFGAVGLPLLGTLNPPRSLCTTEMSLLFL